MKKAPAVSRGGPVSRSHERCIEPQGAAGSTSVSVACVAPFGFRLNPEFVTSMSPACGVAPAGSGVRVTVTMVSECAASTLGTAASYCSAPGTRTIGVALSESSGPPKYQELAKYAVLMG